MGSSWSEKIPQLLQKPYMARLVDLFVLRYHLSNICVFILKTLTSSITKLWYVSSLLLVFAWTVIIVMQCVWFDGRPWLGVTVIYSLLCTVRSSCLVRCLLITEVGWQLCYFSVESSKLILVYSTETFKLEIDIITTRMIKVLYPGF